MEEPRPHGGRVAIEHVLDHHACFSDSPKGQEALCDRELEVGRRLTREGGLILGERLLISSGGGEQVPEMAAQRRVLGRLLDCSTQDVDRIAHTDRPYRVTDRCHNGAASVGGRRIRSRRRMPVTGRYEDICAAHEWRVPERYNIAADCCDKHPRDKLAMIHERFDGVRRELTWGEIQDLSNRAANLLEAHGVERGDRVAVVMPPTPETAAIFFGTWKLGALLLSMSVLYGDDGIAHRLNDSQPRVLVTDAANAPRFEGVTPVQAGDMRLLVLDADVLAGESTQFESVDTAADDPAQLYYTSGTT